MLSLNDLKRQKQNLITEINRIKTKNNAIQKDVDRLKTAYDKLKKLKDNDANALKKDLKRSVCIGELQWKSNVCNEFNRWMDENIKRNANDFYDSIDDMLDQLNKAISKKKSQKTTGLKSIDRLNKSYNDVCTAISNFFN